VSIIDFVEGAGKKDMLDWERQRNYGYRTAMVWRTGREGLKPSFTKLGGECNSTHLMTFGIYNIEKYHRY
jgi:hypothetical protein